MFLKFWMIFAKSLSFVYDEIFHIRNWWNFCFLHPKEVEMKKFAFRQSLQKVINFNHLFFTPNSLFSKFSKRVFIVFTNAGSAILANQIHTRPPTSSLIYTNSPSMSRKVFSILFLTFLIANELFFKFVVVDENSNENPFSEYFFITFFFYFFFCKHKKIQIPRTTCRRKLSSVRSFPRKIAKKKCKPKSVFTFVSPAEPKVIFFLSFAAFVANYWLNVHFVEFRTQGKIINFFADRTEKLFSLQFCSFLFHQKCNALQIQLNFTSIYLSRYPPWLVILFVANFYSFVWFNEKLK